MAGATASHLVTDAEPSEAEVLDVLDISGGRFPILAKENLASTFLRKRGGTGVAEDGPPMRRLERGSFSLSPGFGKLPSLRVLTLFAKEVQVLPEQEGLLKHHQKRALQIPERNILELPDHHGAEATQDLDIHKLPVKLLTPRLPAYQGNLSALRRLVVTQYAITHIQPEIVALTSLEELDLSFNRISCIPSEIGSLVGLKVLRLSSNRIASPLPAELERLVSLEILILSHNKLTSIKPVNLAKLLSLTYLDLQYNDLQEEVEEPAWVTCNLEGNELLTSDNFGLELLERPSDEETEPEIKAEDASVDKEMTDLQRPSVELPHLDNAFQAESRVKSPVRKRERQDVEAWEEDAPTERECRMADVIPPLEEDSLGGEGRDVGEGEGEGGAAPKPEDDISIEDAAREDAEEPGLERELKMNDVALQAEELAAGANDGASDPANIEDAAALQQEPPGTPKIEEGLAACENEAEAPDGDGQEERVRMGRSQSREESAHSDSECEEWEEEEMALGRKHVRRRDGNPKPTKRRRAVLESSPVSEKYHRESLCGVDDRLHDGFYDPGRDRPFRSLEEFEREAPCLHSREVILVDRARDEDLDVIASSARSLLSNLQPACSSTEHSARALALFVSDCFGGSDRSDDLVTFRRATLSIPSPNLRSPLMTSSSHSMTSPGAGSASLAAQAAAALPGLRALCEGAVRFLKQRRGSNVVPIGALPVGICRHRAILFKYLCDRASPLIKCELVRGYLDYEPHAWNMVLFEEEGELRRLLVDACRPGRIHNEGEGDTAVRYLPLKRINIEHFGAAFPASNGTAAEEIALHEEIGRGSSGAVVRRCTIGGATVAAKVVSSGALSRGSAAGATGQNRAACAPQGLSELRTLYSLGPHPCIVRCHGHQIRASESGSSPHELRIFLEHFQSGSLEALIRRRSDQGLEAPLPPLLAVQIALRLARGLSFLHSRGIIHRDVKSGNVLVEVVPGGTPRVKLCDFSSAVPVGSSSADLGGSFALGGNPPADVCVGTPRWMAPDVLRAMYGRHPYGTEADVWSFGCVVLEMLTLAPPYSGLTEAQVHSWIQIGRRPDLPSDMHQLRPQPLHSSLEDLLVSIPGEDEEALSLRALVGVFYACTVGDAALRPKASHIVGVLEKVLERKLVEKVEMEEEEGADREGADSEPGTEGEGEGSSGNEEGASEESFADQSPEEAAVQSGSQEEEIKVTSKDEKVNEHPSS
ncbi:Protein kinase superfamily protein [Klebsormidium nitens]|uniref:Protein kinase superfamily protein n=1 Tax=Klebsormidium nitens TaxID=105231 RepID=A0A1Y1HN95_KLENI|nr:Protein kinase superfamily protein [Klebsormidium nitens]|eukprot:GAQ79493.1 Protein kinase superfamily protein [Klebsormidium nitens]